MEADAVSLLPPVGPLYGAFYFGTVMTTAFYGVTCMQTFFYYVRYQNDPLSMKIFVAVLWALNTIHEVLSIIGTYKYLMAGLMNPLSFMNGSPDLVLQLLFTAMVATASQGFFVYRIYVFSGKKLFAPLLIVWVLLAILQLATVIIYVEKALYSVDSVNVQVLLINVSNKKPFMTLGTLFLSVSAAVDVLIAISMTFLLLRTRAATGFARTAHILQRLIMFSVNTGFWTATFAILTIILLYVFPTNVLYAVLGIPVCAVYCNTLLANLNARVYIGGRETAENVDMDLFANSTIQVSDGTGTRTDRWQGESNLVSSAQQDVWKTTEVIAFSDANLSAPSAIAWV